MENTVVKTEISSPIFRTIGEVASEIGIPPHVLRFWESKFDIIKPHKRKGGHRYYKPADIQAIRDIKRLLYDEGFTIKGAQKFLKDKDLSESPDFQANLFETSFEENPKAANVNDEISNASNSDEANGVLKNIVVQLNIMKRNIEEAR